MTLKKYIEQDLIKKSMSAHELAGKMEISYTVIYKILKNKTNFRPKTIRLIAKYYDLDIAKVVEMLDN